ncbi:hypothetical protein O9929_20685 [Vibrio lentus]|nr:hypothetical protein [Vibrio lentus]
MVLRSVRLTQSLTPKGSDDFSHFRIYVTNSNPGDLLKSNGLVVQLKKDPASAGDYIGYTDDGMGNVTSCIYLALIVQTKLGYIYLD